MMARHDDGFTLLELLMVVALIGILGGIAVPKLLMARTSSNEASVVGSLRAVLSGQAIYSSTCGSGLYAPTLARLAAAPAGGGAGFIGTDLSTDPSVKSTYNVAMTGGAPWGGAPASCNGAAAGTLVSTYFVGASPIAGAGSRHFGANQGGTIFQSSAVVAVTQVGPPAGATPIP